MEGALSGWSRKEKLNILRALSNLDFDKLEKQISGRSRLEIKEAVLYMVNTLADAPSATDRFIASQMQQMLVNASSEANAQVLESLAPQIVRLITCASNVPPPDRVWNVNIRELFNQVANAMEGKPVVADAAINDVLQTIVEEVISLSDGYMPPGLKDFKARIDASAIPMPPSRAPRQLQRPADRGVYYKESANTPASSVHQPICGPANTNFNTIYAQAKTNTQPIYAPNTSPVYVPNSSPMYQPLPPVNTNTSPMYLTVNTKTSPMYPQMNANISPMYPPVNTNTSPMFPPVNTNTSPMFPPVNTKTSPMYPPMNSNNSQMYPQVNANTSPMYPPVNTNIPPMFAHLEPCAPTHDAPANFSYKPIYSAAKYNYNPVFPPVHCNFNPIFSPVQCSFPNIFTSAEADFGPIYTPIKTNGTPIFTTLTGNMPRPMFPPVPRQIEQVHAPATGQYESTNAPPNYGSIYPPAQHNPVYPPNFKSPGKTNVVPAKRNLKPKYASANPNSAPATYTVCEPIFVNTAQRSFEPSNIAGPPGPPSRLELPYHPRPNGRRGQIKNKNE